MSAAVCSRAPLWELLKGGIQHTVILNSQTGHKHADIEVRILTDTGQHSTSHKEGLGEEKAKEEYDDTHSQGRPPSAFVVQGKPLKWDTRIRERLIGTHISVPAEIKLYYCTTDIRDNGYSRQEYPVPRRPI